MAQVDAHENSVTLKELKMDLTRNLQRLDGRRSRHWLLLAAASVAGIAAYLLLHRGRSTESKITLRQERKEHIVDDLGTDQHAAWQILTNLRERAFAGSDEKLALALGRPQDEVTAWAVGREVIDDDVVIKARSIARLRGIAIE